MLLEVLAAARISHLVQLQSLHPKRNLPDDASWAAPAQPVTQILLPAADALVAGGAGSSQQFAAAPVNG